jgi:hypothetical protein
MRNASDELIALDGSAVVERVLRLHTTTLLSALCRQHDALGTRDIARGAEVDEEDPMCWRALPAVRAGPLRAQVPGRVRTPTSTER